jgi:DNA-binding transcriptional ArsR family regulator
MDQTLAITTAMRALADPTRRAILERVARSDEMTVVELTRGSGVTQGAISQHLKHLKQAGLVTERPEPSQRGWSRWLSGWITTPPSGVIGSTTSKTF